MNERSPLIREYFPSYPVGVFIQYTDSLIDEITTVKQRRRALKSYFKSLGTSFFVIEDDYVCKDYLEDYKNYYSTCFADYPKKTLRLHFFGESSSIKIGGDVHDLEKLQDREIITNYIERLNEAYHGFMVIRPIAAYKIGRTCLKSYNDEREGRNRRYTTTKPYTANLYGIALSVRSMPFQEQEQTVAACATISAWSAFHITSTKFQHHQLAPSQITKIALSESSFRRNFPNEGLTIEQIAVATTKVGLTPLLAKPSKPREAKGIIYGYLHAGIPIICGVSIYDLNEEGKILPDTQEFHAVTINGYSFENESQPNEKFEDTILKFEDTILNIKGRKEIRLFSSAMSRFYAHDDQLCPFARMVFSENLKGGNFIPVTTSWENNTVKIDDSIPSTSEDELRFKVACIEALLVPLDEMIRITYQDIVVEVSRIERDLLSLFDASSVRLQWKIFLTELSELRSDTLHNMDLTPEFRNDILLLSLPKYLWRVDMYEVGLARPSATFIFDATQTKKGKLLLFKTGYVNKSIEKILERLP